jgi:hypothetical protein
VAMICVNCSALPGPPNDTQGHSAYLPANIEGIMRGTVTYAAGPHHQVFEDGVEEGLGRQSPQDCVPRTVEFRQWFIDTVCNPLHAILQRGRSSQVIVVFFDDNCEDRCVALGHLFGCSIPQLYQAYHRLLNPIARPCIRDCSICSGVRAQELRFNDEATVASLMMEHCFSRLGFFTGLCFSKYVCPGIHVSISAQLLHVRHQHA